MKRGQVLTTETREGIVEAYIRVGGVHEAAEVYHVLEREVYRDRARVVDSSPVNRPASHTIIGELTLDGPIAFLTWLGGTTKYRFEIYVDKVLVPELAPGDIVIMATFRPSRKPGSRAD